MRYQKIEFIEWRDPPAADRSAVPAEVAAAQAQLAAVAKRRAEVGADVAHTETLLAKVKSEQAASRLAGLVMELDNLHQADKASRAALEAAGIAAERAMREHPRVGTTGYMVIDTDRGELVKVVDDAGADLPAGVVYGYRVTDAEPAPPAWAQGGKR